MAATRGWLVPAGAVALLGIAAVALLAWPRTRGRPVASESSAAAADEVVALEEEDVARAAVAREGASSSSAAPVNATSEAAAATTWTLWGTLLRAADGAPAAGLRFALGPDFAATSDAFGRFELELPALSRPRGSRRQVWISHASGKVLLHEELALEPGMTLRIDDEIVWLHGRVVDGLGAPLVPDGLSLSCELGEGHGRLLGRPADCDPEGRFRVAARPVELECESAVLQLWLGWTQFPLSTTIASLRSSEGATVVLDVCPLKLELRASDGGELAEPELRVVAWRPGALRAEVQSFPDLGETLDARLFVERDVERIEIAAGATGCAPWVEVREVPRCGSTQHIELRRLGPDDVLAGVVLDADGRPVANAFASCAPPSLDRELVAVPAIRGVRTDAQGRFSLPFAAGATARLMAYHRDHGSTGEVFVTGGRRDVVLRFRPVARLDVTVTTPDGESPGREPARFTLGLANGTWVSDLGADGRATFEEVPLGSHTLLCLSSDERWWLATAVAVFDTGPQEVRRTLAAARWVEGTLLDARDAPLAGIEVRNTSTLFAPGMNPNPFVAISSSDGRFRVLLGSALEGLITFQSESAELGRTLLVAGEAGRLRLDP
jgi:hypothetical protein